MTTYTPNAAGLAAIQSMLHRHLGTLAQAHADALKDHLNRAGSGKHHPHQPNPSSAPGEYPARQTAGLRDAVDARPVGLGHYRIGFWNAPPYAVGIEFKAPSRGGRAPIRRFMAEVQTM